MINRQPNGFIHHFGVMALEMSAVMFGIVKYRLPSILKSNVFFNKNHLLFIKIIVDQASPLFDNLL